MLQPGINGEGHRSSRSHTGEEPDHPESRLSTRFWTSWSWGETKVLQPLHMLVIRGDSRLLWEEVVHFPRFRLEHPSKARRLRVEADKVIL